MRKKIMGLIVAFTGIFISVSVSEASTADIIQPAGATTFFESIRVGLPGVGGVTFFNGSVLNESGPFVIADELRVDGAIFRVERGGSNAVKIADSIIPESNNVYDLGSASNKWKSIYAGSVTVNSLVGTGIINGENIASGAIKNTNVSAVAAIDPTKISGTALIKGTNFSGDVAGKYNNLQIGAGKIGNAEIASGAVTNAKIDNNTIKNEKISSSANIAASKIAGIALIQTTLFGGDIGGVYNNIEINENTVGATEIADGSITNSDIYSAAAINPSKILGTALTSGTMFAGDVSGTYSNLQIGEGVVDSREIANSSIIDQDISNEAEIDNAKIYGIALTQSFTNFAGDISGSWNNLQIGSGKVGSVEIVDGSVANLDLAGGIAPAKISGTALIQSTTFGGDVSGTYNTLQIAAGVVGSNEIANNSIVDADINASANIAASKINDGMGSGLDADTVDGFDIDAEVGFMYRPSSSTSDTVLTQITYNSKYCRMVYKYLNPGNDTIVLENETGGLTCEYWGNYNGAYFSGSVAAGASSPALCTVETGINSCQLAFGHMSVDNGGYVQSWLLQNGTGHLKGYYLRAPTGPYPMD